MVFHGSRMASMAPPTFDRKSSVALLVARNQRRFALSPFFAKSDGLLLVDPVARRRRYRTNPDRTQQSTCDLILASGATRLICGFVGGPERDRLRAAGIDVRVASCARAVNDLVASFETLPSA